MIFSEVDFLILGVQVCAHCASGAGAPPQHAWAAASLDACKLEELRCCRSRNSSGSSSSEDSGSSGDGSSSGGPGSSGDAGCSCTAGLETFLDWGTPYAHVDRDVQVAVLPNSMDTYDPMLWETKRLQPR